MKKGDKNKNNRFVIESINVNAPISLKKVRVKGKMPMPNSPDDIAYYDFSLFPSFGGKIGEPGNAIFSGHVDSGFEYCDYGKTPPPCMAVLWDLDKIERGDKIEIVFKGKKYQYVVLSNRKIKPFGKKWRNIFMANHREMVTVFTCAGGFDEKKHNYNSRQVVQAIREAEVN